MPERIALFRFTAAIFRQFPGWLVSPLRPVRRRQTTMNGNYPRLRFASYKILAASTNHLSDRSAFKIGAIVSLFNRHSHDDSN